MAEHTVAGRMMALTDGVVAIAMTLLVLDIRLPDGVAEDGVTWAELLTLRHKLVSYAVSFLVVALLWLVHARKFRKLARVNGAFFWLNSLFLLGVGLVPFTASLLAAGRDAVSTQVYAGVLAFASFMLGLMEIHVGTTGLDREDAARAPLSPDFLWLFEPTAVFLLSILVSLWSVPLAQLCWLLTIPVTLHRRRRKRAAAR